MFELMRPQKEMVGKRIGETKKELGVSFTELGNRLGLIKPTINSYAQGYTLAPLEVIEQLSKITGKSVGWFYFGDMEEYIRDYLLKKGQDALLADYPDLPVKLKAEFVNSKNSNWDWENEFGYPCEEALDELFIEVYEPIMKEYFTELTTGYVTAQTSLDAKKQKEVIRLICAELYECFVEMGDFKYGEKDEIERSIRIFYERSVKDEEITFNDEYLVGKLINVLNDEKQTVDLINRLSFELTEKGGFNSFFGGTELVDIFQSMRPMLIKLYGNHTSDEFYEWFDK